MPAVEFKMHAGLGLAIEQCANPRVWDIVRHCPPTEYISHQGMRIIRNRRSDSRFSRLPVHRLQMMVNIGRDLGPGEEVDHVDGNPLNNHPHNLVLTDRSHCLHGHNRLARSKTGYRGVKQTGEHRFEARIGYRMNTVLLGTYNSAEVAARAVDWFRHRFELPLSGFNFPDSVDRTLELYPDGVEWNAIPVRHVYKKKTNRVTVRTQAEEAGL